MHTEFLELIAQAEVVLVGDRPYKAQWELRDSGIVLRWLNTQNELCTVTLTDEELAAGDFVRKTKTFEFEDGEGLSVLVRLLNNGQHLAPPEIAAARTEKTLYLLVHSAQHAGLPLQIYRTRTAAQTAGGEGTDQIIEVPASLGNHPQFSAIANAIVAAARRTRT